MPGVLDSLTFALPSAPSPPAFSHPGGELRAFDDPLTTRRMIYKNVLDEARKLPPVSNKVHTLELSDVDYEDPEDISLEKHKRAILTGDSLHRRLRGTFNLKDNATGDILDQKRVTIAQVPHMTRHGSFVINGSEYSLANQTRLRPGIFTRVKQNGEVESHVNILPGQGLSHHLLLDPETGVFRINIGQARIPLMPLLKAMGVGDSELQKEWGNEVFVANARQNDTRAIDKLYTKLSRSRPGDPEPESRAKVLADTFKAMKLDPEVTKRTLGKAFDSISPESMLTATKKMVAVHKGDEEPDDRDHLAYQTLLGPEDLLGERIRTASRVLRPLLWKTTLNKNLSRIQPGFLSKHLQAAITGSGVGQAMEEVNPAEIVDQMTRVTRMGEGGIPSIDSIPDDSRSVHPSQFSFIDPLRTPESSRVGVDTRLSSKALKGQDGRIYAPFQDPRTGQTHYLSPQDVADQKVAFPEELQPGKKHVLALVGGKFRRIRRNDIGLLMPEMEHSFNQLSNLIPYKSSTKGQRVAMGSRMYTQALPPEHPETPWVGTMVPGSNDRSYEEEIGKHLGALHAQKDGQVVSVSPSGITVKYADGTTETHETYENFPFNRKTMWHQTAMVQPGQSVKSGDLLAKSNFTDDQGRAAMGINLRTAYASFRGLNFEDAKLISASAAKKLSSGHMYQHDTEFDDNVRRGKNAFVSLFPAVLDRNQLSQMDDDGVVKPGTVVQPGDPLVLVARERERGRNQISRGKDSSFKDATEKWEHHVPGIVTDVTKTKNGVGVTVKSVHEMQVGDKLSGRYGDKGIISGIIPDDEMPHDQNGVPFESIENPLSVITRTNPSQMAEAALGKIAALTGKHYKIQDFKNGASMVNFALAELAKHGLSDTEDIIDPTTQRKIPGVFTGNRFYMKLHHMAEDKSQGRSIGGYTQDETPSKGGEGDSSKRVSIMDIHALLSHGSVGAVRDASAIRGQKSLDWWASYMLGHTPPEPKVPFIHQKFYETLRAGGINPIRRGAKIQLLGLTRKDVDQLAEDRNIENSETVDWKEGMKPIVGGLFDPTLTGGHNANRWAAVKLHEPMPNPVMEDPIKKILGLTGKEFEGILSGRERLHGLSGPKAIASALENIDLDKEITKARQDVSSSKKTVKDLAMRRLQLLKHTKETGLHPGDWVLDRVPVLPTVFRPVSIMAGNKLPMVSDANYVYKELIEANHNLKNMSQEVGDLGEERLALYHAFKGVTGLGEPITTKNQERKVKGVLQSVFGSSPKFGALQRKLLGSNVDLVGRAVISPNPDLDMDQIGLPEEKAWEMYKPFVIHNLVRHGMGPVRAAELVKSRDPLAGKALQSVMSERPVIATRAPVLHRYGVMAFWPQLVQANTLQLPLVTYKGFGADNDGDAMTYHIPFDDQAVKDAVEKMLPSRNLFSSKNFKVHQLPSNEYAAALYRASTESDDDGREHVFHAKADAVRAFREGRINAKTRIVVMDH